MATDLGQAARASRICPLCHRDKSRGALLCRRCYNARRARARRCRPALLRPRSRAELAAAKRLREQGFSWAAALAMARLRTLAGRPGGGGGSQPQKPGRG